METTENTFKKYLLDNHEKDELKDLANYGATGGFGGMIYYYQTEALYNEHAESLWLTLEEIADMYGEKPLEVLAKAFDITNETTFKNSIVWLCAEYLAQQIVNDEDDEA